MRPFSRYRLLLALLAGVGLIIVGLNPAPRPRPDPPTPASPSHRQIYWGAQIGPQYTGEAVPWSMSGLSAFQRRVGKAPSLVAFNVPFTICNGKACTPYPFPVRQMQAIRSYGAIPMLNWSSQYSPISVNQPAYRLAAVANGRFDAYLRSFARQVRAWSHPFFLRFDWEMNGFWFPWGETANGNHRGDFVRAWRHVHDVFTEEGADNVSWVWCPRVNNGDLSSDTPELYPGDAYVNWTCLDGYNFGEPFHRRWQTFSDLFARSYRRITEQIAPSKPMLIGEIGSGDQGGSKAVWIHSMLSEILAGYRRLFGFVYFDVTDPRPGYRNLGVTLEQPASSLAAFSAGVATPRFLSNRFATLDHAPNP